MSYDDFLSRKALVAPPCGIDPPALSPKLKEHQRLLTQWALRRGRAAIFADTGLGKGWMILEWARCVAEHTGKPVLILAPLAVSQQFMRESDKLWLETFVDAPVASIKRCHVQLCSSQSDVTYGVNVTNYAKLHKFDPSAFGGVALDEASILKSLDGKTRRQLIDSFRDTPFKLCATATPSPNDHTELGGQAEFLGVMTQQEMLGTFFVHDGGSTQDWRLKGHARDAFWKWVCSWGAIVKMPSDIGCSDDGYTLPELRYREHILPATTEDARKSGLLFAQPAETLIEQRNARRGSLGSRVSECADIANGKKWEQQQFIDRETWEIVGGDGQVIVWCDLNAESEALACRIAGAEEVTGSQDDDVKEAIIERFVSGKTRVLVSKPSICGFGLNLQFVSTVIFCGVTHSFEQFYQAVRRCWRFGQERPVDVHIVSSELEGRVVDNLKAKQRKADELSSETRHHVSRYVKESVTATERSVLPYNATQRITWPEWLRSENG